MKKNNWIMSTLPFVVAFAMFISACGTEQSNSDKEQTSEASEDTSGVSENDGSSSGFENPGFTSNERDPEWYVYGYPEVEPIEETDPKKVSSSKKGNVPHVKATPVVYSISQTDSPPLFSKECLTAKNPEKCSNQALKEWIRENITYPKADLKEGHDGLEHITFVINQRGKISTIQELDTKMEACEGCGVAALNAVTSMPDWVPAKLNGKPVSVVVTLPIRFLAL